MKTFNIEEVINDVRHMTFYFNWEISFIMTVWFLNMNNPNVHNKNNFATLENISKNLYDITIFLMSNILNLANSLMII